MARMPQESASKEEKRPVRIGKYEVIAHIATGGMGAVYKALDTDLQRLVALKILSPELAAKPSMVQRFKREGRSAAKLRHENIVAIYECSEWGGSHFLALEFVDGVDLYDYITQRQRLGVAEARQILIQAARALDHAHHNRIVHRDIKPSNFLITKDQHGQLLVKLTDLGLARQVNDDEFRVTKADSTIGTVDYMSPEQAQNSGSADIRSDIYSLGCTFFHMLAGKCPYPTGTLVERVLKHREAEPPDIREHNKAVPAPVARIMNKMLAKKPADRYQTPRELLDELDNAENFPDVENVFDPGLVPLEPGPGANPPNRKVKRAAQPGEVSPTVEYARRGKTEEFQRPDKRPAPKNTRPREQPGDKPRSKHDSKARRQAWWPWAAAGSAVVLIVAVALWRPWFSSAPSPIDDGPDPRQAVTINRKTVPKEKPTPEPKPIPAKMGPEEPILPRLYRPAQPLDRAALRREFLGPFQTMSAPPPAKVVRVRRLPGTGEYHSIGEALAKTTGPVVIEIHDQGPIFEPSWPAVNQRSLWIRGGTGFRPLLAWDVAADTNKLITSPLLTLTEGTLTLEDVDIVAKWPAGRGLGPGCLFALRDGHLRARDCTLTIAGKFPHGMALVKTERVAPSSTAALETAQVNPMPPPAATARVHFLRCFARGSDMAAVDARGVALDLLVEGSLLVGGDRPMIQVTGHEQDAVTLRLVRSTLVCGQNCIRWNSLTGQPGSPRIQVLAWDSLLARAGAATSQGDMLLLADNANLENVTWWPVNCLYAGWTRLLASADKNVSSNAIATWRTLVSIREGDQELAETWPPLVPAEPEALPAQAFAPHETAVLFAATAGSGALGCELGRLPPEPYLALQRTFERYPLPVVALPDTDGPPSISVAEDGLYHGERLDLTKVDLGKHLEERFRSSKPAPRVVLHLAGKGKQFTSPIKVSGITNLVLFFETSQSQAEPLTLLLKPQPPDAAAGLIEVADGNLELIGARLQVESKAGLGPAHLIKAHGGNLHLNRCYLQGVTDKDNVLDGYHGLIRVDTTDGGPADVLVQNSVLLSARSLLELNGRARLRVRNCAAVAVDDGFVFAPAPTSGHNVFVDLEKNTLAFRRTLVAVRGDQALPENSQGIVLTAERNYFVNPFSEEPRHARLVRIAAPDLARGALLWQGKQNVFDHLRFGYVASDEASKKQPLKEWRRIWGTPGEQDAVTVEGVKPAKAFTPNPPSWPHLVLPPRVRVGSGAPSYGADLVGLGLVKRKE
jgi:serine/threonine-protein kinase